MERGEGVGASAVMQGTLEGISSYFQPMSLNII